MSYWRESQFNRVQYAASVFTCAGVPMMWTASTNDLRALGVLLTFIGDVFIIFAVWPARFVFSLRPFCVGNPRGGIFAAGWATRPGGRSRRTVFYAVRGRPRWRLRLWPAENPHPIVDCEPIEEASR